MPRQVDINSRPEKSDEEVILASLFNMLHYKTQEDGSPSIKRSYGTGYRSRLIVISDSDSDDDLPPPASLLQFQSRKAVVPGSNLGSRDSDEIIDISSDSEVEDTPTKPGAGKRLPAPGIAGTGARAVGGAAGSDSVSTSVSSLSTALEKAISLDREASLEPIQSEVDSCIDSAAGRSQPIESSSTESEELDENQLLEEGGYHPGILHFDPGPRRPALITSGSATSISTPGTSDYSQDSWGKDGVPSDTQTSDDVLSPTEGQSDDPFGDGGSLDKESKTPRRSVAIGSAKATGSGRRGRVKGNNDEEVGAPETPRPRPKPKARAATLATLSAPISVSPKPTPRNRAKLLEAAASTLFAELNDSVFGGRLPKDCPIEWSKKLSTTAGRAHWKRIRGPGGVVVGHDTRIELSAKVVDSEERVKNTLSHEMCHLAAWIVDSEIKPPHGGAFKRWSDRVMEARSDITISTCHSYEISYKFEWKCSSEACGKTYGRHSKSIDPEKQACGVCRGKLIPLFATTPRRNPFQDYLKTHMKEFKAANPGMQHGEAMRRLGEMFRAEKEATVDEELDQVMAGMTRLAIQRHAE